MAAWAAYELLKVTTSYLLSPFSYSSSLFFAALGYSSSRSGDTQALMSSLARTRSITGSRRQPSRRDASSTSKITPSFFEEPSVGERFEEEEHSRIASQLSTSVLEDRPSFPTPSPSHRSDPSTESTISLSGTSTPLSPLEPVAESYDAEITSPDSTAFAARPLSSILSTFSYRATVCLSSFKLLDEDHSFETWHEREPTVKEVEEILHERLRTEAEVVERVIEDAIDKRGIGEEVKVPEGETYFEEMKKSFVDVQIQKEGINTGEFLEAVESLVTMFELFASSAFALVSGEILEDIRRVRIRYTAFPEECRTLELLVKNESRERRRLATEALLWLFRGLRFTAVAIRLNVESESEELSESFTRAWELEYSKYFSWIVKPFFRLLIRACPRRAEFYERLGSPRELVLADLLAWLSALEKQVYRLEVFYRQGKHDKGF